MTLHEAPASTTTLEKAQRKEGTYSQKAAGEDPTPLKVSFEACTVNHCDPVHDHSEERMRKTSHPRSSASLLFILLTISICHGATVLPRGRMDARRNAFIENVRFFALFICGEKKRKGRKVEVGDKQVCCKFPTRCDWLYSRARVFRAGTGLGPTSFGTLGRCSRPYSLCPSCMYLAVSFMRT